MIPHTIIVTIIIMIEIIGGHAFHGISVWYIKPHIGRPVKEQLTLIFLDRHLELAGLAF